MVFRTVEAAIDKFIFLEGIYQEVRIVNPITKDVIPVFGNLNPSSCTKCFELNACDRKCDECITMFAFFGKKTDIRIQDGGGKTYFIQALPIRIGETPWVTEMLLEISEQTASCYSLSGAAKDPMDPFFSEYIEHLILSDELTELYNRRFVEERLPKNLCYAHNSKVPLSVIYLDLDYFKQINDTYGHLTGDRILKKIAKFINGKISDEKCWAARYGGDEFLICLPGESSTQAKLMAESIREGIENLKFKVFGNSISVTCSLGISTVTEKKCVQTAEEVIQSADRNLYKAKENGRNCVIFE